MEDMYGFHSISDYTIPPETNLISPPEFHGVDHYRAYYGSENLLSATASIISEAVSVEEPPDQIQFPIRRRNNRQRDQNKNEDADADEDDNMIKAKIANHPLYPKLLDAFIDCQKLGAPPEIVGLLDEIGRENGVCMRNSVVSTGLGADPELDDFMEMYRQILLKYKSDLTRPFDEATVFFTNIESQLNNLCKELFYCLSPSPNEMVEIMQVLTFLAAFDVQSQYFKERDSDLRTKDLIWTLRFLKDDVVVSSEEELSAGATENTQASREDQELKDTLLRKFGGRISSLKHEFSKKKKKGKLPNEARQTLLEWWDSHYKWPYPTEADKISLAETTGLDQKQINNWFINQRKRHWKPSENMQLAIMGSFSGQDYYDD